MIYLRLSPKEKGGGYKKNRDKDLLMNKIIYNNDNRYNVTHGN